MESDEHSSWEGTWEEILAQDEWLVPPGTGAFLPVATCLQVGAVRESDRLRRRMVAVEAEVAEAVLAGLWHAPLGWSLRPEGAFGHRLRRLAGQPYVVALCELADPDSSFRSADWEPIVERVRGSQDAWPAAQRLRPERPAEVCVAVLVAFEVRLPWVAESAFRELLEVFGAPPGDVFSALVADGMGLCDAARAAALVA